MTINEIFEKLNQATEEYREAQLQENNARVNRIDILNKINELQKSFDKEINNFKLKMPTDSDWNTKPLKKVDV